MAVDGSVLEICDWIFTLLEHLRKALNLTHITFDEEI